MAKARKENSNLQWYFRWLNNCWKYRLAVTGIVAAIIAMWFWRFWLQSNDELSGIWYKKFIEENLWINILIFVYTVYTATIWGYYSCRFRKRWYHLFFYGITIGTLWVVPALEPVNTPIASISYHVWATIVMGLMALMEICFMLFHSESDTQTNDSNGFLAHIEEERHQDTGWSKYVDTLLRMIGSAQMQQDSFTIGITGSWGSGKTTFYKLIRKKLKEEGKFGICEFQPWQVVNYTQLSSQFFVTFKQYLINQGVLPESDLISNISKYAGVLESIPEVSSFAKPIINAIQAHEDSTLQTLHDQIGDILAEKKFLTAVMIDDLDRLNQNELMEVLRLIRVSANFRNVLFVVTYDKGHISKVMGEHGKEYLKKIVNVEINLPPIENYKYADILLENIRQIVPSLSRDQIDCLREVLRTKNMKTGNTLLYRYSHNFRDLLRFSNHFGLVLGHLQAQGVLDDYSLFDLFWLEMLRYFDENTYYQLQEHPLSILKREIESRTKQDYLVLKAEINKSEDINSKDILAALFDSDRRFFEENIIIWRNNFNNYFAHRQLDNAVSMVQFTNIVTETNFSIKLREQINEWCSGHARASLVSVVNSYPHNNVFPSEQASLNYVRVLFYLLHKKVIDIEEFKDIIHTKGHLEYFRKIHNYPFDRLLHRVIVMHHGIEWNYLLTSLCMTEDNDVRDYEEYISFQDHVKYILNNNQLENLAQLNYKLQFTRQIIPLQELFNLNNKHMQFIESLTYTRRIIGEEDKQEKQYSNLIGNYLIEQYSIHNQRILGSKEFKTLYSNLLELSGVDQFVENEELAKSLVVDTIEQTLGSLNNFSSLISRYFKLNVKYTNFCRNTLGLKI